MGVHAAVALSGSQGGSTGGTTEVVALTSSPIVTPSDSCQVLILFSCPIVTANGVTSVAWRVRFGTGVGGRLINTNSVDALNIGASTSGTLSGLVVDTPGPVGQAQYVLTLVFAGNTGTSSWNDAFIAALAL